MMFEGHIWDDEFHHEGCFACGNEDVFHSTADGNLICGVCGTTLEVQRPNQKVNTDAK